MDAALEQVVALRQTSHFEPAALKNPGPGHRDGGKATGTFGNDRFAGAVQRGDEPSPKLLHLSVRQLINSHLVIPVMYEFGSRFYC
jgi:hypothetical protein